MRSVWGVPLDRDVGLWGGVRVTTQDNYQGSAMDGAVFRAEVAGSYWQVRNTGRRVSAECIQLAAKSRIHEAATFTLRPATRGSSSGGVLSGNFFRGVCSALVSRIGSGSIDCQAGNDVRKLAIK